MNKWEIRYFVYHKNNRSWKCECQKLIAHSISKCHQLDTLNCSMIDLVLGFFFIFGLKTSISFIRLQLRLALHRIFLFIFSVLFISIIFFCFILFVLKLHWIFFCDIYDWNQSLVQSYWCAFDSLIHYWYCSNVNRSIQFSYLFSYAMLLKITTATKWESLLTGRCYVWKLINAFDTFFPTLKDIY